MATKPSTHSTCEGHCRSKLSQRRLFQEVRIAEQRKAGLKKCQSHDGVVTTPYVREHFHLLPVQKHRVLISPPPMTEEFWALGLPRHPRPTAPPLLCGSPISQVLLPESYLSNSLVLALLHSRRTSGFCRQHPNLLHVYVHHLESTVIAIVIITIMSPESMLKKVGQGCS